MLSPLRRVATVTSALLLSGSVLCRLAPSDALAPVTVWPFTLVAAGGLALLVLGPERDGRRRWLALVVAWLVAWGWFGGELAGLCRRRVAPAGTIRVVSVNCRWGQVAAAREAARPRPDILLLQESPGGSLLRPLWAELHGTALHHVVTPDAVVATWGEIRPVPPVLPYLVESRVRLGDGPELAVFCVHFDHLPRPWRLWSAAQRTELAAARQRHRQQMAELLARVRAVPPGLPIVVGGDFNESADEPLCRSLGATLRDAWTAAGAGWGDTVPNRLPVARIDQIWTSSALPARRAQVRRSSCSDHRWLLAELTYTHSQY